MFFDTQYRPRFRKYLAFLCRHLGRLGIPKERQRIIGWSPKNFRMGCDGIDVDSIKALDGALAGRRARDRPLVIGARIDPAQYAAQF